jgi:hypothetical protein
MVIEFIAHLQHIITSNCNSAQISITRDNLLSLLQLPLVVAWLQSANKGCSSHLYGPRNAFPNRRLTTVVLYPWSPSQGAGLPFSHWFEVRVRVRVKSKVTLRLTIRGPVSLGVKPQIFLLLSKSCGLVYVGRPIWGEDGSVIYRGHGKYYMSSTHIFIILPVGVLYGPSVV